MIVFRSSAFMFLVYEELMERNHGQHQLNKGLIRYSWLFYDFEFIFIWYLLLQGIRFDVLDIKYEVRDPDENRSKQ